jgi:hypothetical protein
VASAALTALLITFIAWSTLYRPGFFPYMLEVSVQVEAPAATQIYFDLGEGLRETNSTNQRVRMGMNSVRLPLPAGNYRSLRFDPIDRGGTTSFSDLKILGPRGDVARRISLSELTPNNQVKTAEVVNDRLVVESTSDANDPQFTINFDPELSLPLRFFDQLVVGWAWLLGWFGGSFVVLILAENTWRHRTIRAQRLIILTRERPRLALALCAALAALLSSYPVVFFGKSFVSPNTTHLLYERLPTVPGYLDARPEDSRGAGCWARASRWWAILCIFSWCSRAEHPGRSM